VFIKPEGCAPIKPVFDDEFKLNPGLFCTGCEGVMKMLEGSEAAGGLVAGLENALASKSSAVAEAEGFVALKMESEVDAAGPLLIPIPENRSSEAATGSDFWVAPNISAELSPSDMLPNISVVFSGSLVVMPENMSPPEVAGVEKRSSCFGAGAGSDAPKSSKSCCVC